MRSEDIGLGVYGDGRYLSVWTMVDGYPRCPSPALVLGSALVAEVAATIAGNRAVAAVAARAEAVEAATLLAAQAPPPEMLDGLDAAGEPVLLPNPAHDAWTAAVALVAAAVDDGALQYLLRTRAGALALAVDVEGQPAEAPYVLDLPPVPDLDPLAETADWDGAAWTVRALTPPEAATWPLQAPPVPATVTRTQLRLALAARSLLETVDAAVTLTGDMELVERWGAASMERDSPHLAAMAAGLGLSAADVDDIFRQAAGL